MQSSWSAAASAGGNSVGEMSSADSVGEMSSTADTTWSTADTTLARSAFGQSAGADPGSNWSQASGAAGWSASAWTWWSGYNDYWSFTTQVQNLEREIEIVTDICKSRIADNLLTLAKYNRLNAENARLRADIIECFCAENELWADTFSLAAKNERLRAENERLRAENERLRTDDQSSQMSTSGDIPNGVDTEEMPEEELAPRVVRHAEFLNRWRRIYPKLKDHPQLKEQMMHLMFQMDEVQEKAALHEPHPSDDALGPCPVCDGSGLLLRNTCPLCDGNRVCWRTDSGECSLLSPLQTPENVE